MKSGSMALFNCLLVCFSLSVLRANLLLPDSIPVSADFLMGKYDPATTPGFVRIDAQYTSKENIYLQKGAYDAFKDMYEAAAVQGITLPILSATRNFDYQKQIWEKKWKAAAGNKRKLSKKEGRAIAANILRYSAMPGTSRHHWGTDIDLVSLEPSFFETKEGLRIYLWLKENAPKYGFCQPYKGKSAGRTGYEDEPWHWSWMPLSGRYTEDYPRLVQENAIKGFSGSQFAGDLRVISVYVSGIDQSCLAPK